MTVTVTNGTGTVSNFDGTILHEHAWSNNWAYDGNYHWHACTADNCPITENADKEGYATHTPNDKWSSKSASGLEALTQVNTSHLFVYIAEIPWDFKSVFS